MTDPTIAAWSRNNDLLFQLRQLREENERLREDQQRIDAVATLTEAGWTWDGDQWQRPAQPKGEKHMNQNQDIECYKSQIERQCEEMQATIDRLRATVETLHLRLKPVMVDMPVRHATNEPSPVASPLGLSIHQHRQQTSALIDEVVHIIESIEI